MKKKIAYATVASLLVFAAAPNTASATPPPPPVVHPIIAHPTSATAAGAWAAGGIIGVAAVLVTYDIIRRTTCSGDFLHLGGPGFTEPMPAGNVMIPQCRPVVKKRAALHARG